MLQKVKYAVREICKNYNNSSWLHNRVQYRINSPVQQILRPPSSIKNILDHDWGTLIIIDACRADLFAEVAAESDLFSHWQEMRSVASSTPEWLQRTFEESHGEIVYVAGNAMVSQHRKNCFHELIESWREGYDPDTSIIAPKQVTKDALQAFEKYPNKRLIIHYVQPHYPFIDYPELQYAKLSFDPIFESVHSENEFHDVWEALEAGDVSKALVWEGYKHNLEVVVDEVKKLIHKIDDKIVLTSDHGNMLGGRSWPFPIKTYGHPGYLRIKDLIKVPYCAFDGKRKKIVNGGVNSNDSVDAEGIRQRLRDLGYQ